MNEEHKERDLARHVAGIIHNVICLLRENARQFYKTGNHFAWVFFHTQKNCARQLYFSRWAIAVCFIAWYVIHVASANLQHFVTVSGEYMAGVNQAQLNDRLDQRAQVVNAIQAVAAVVKAGKVGL